MSFFNAPPTGDLQAIADVPTVNWTATTWFRRRLFPKFLGGITLSQMAIWISPMLIALPVYVVLMNTGQPAAGSAKIALVCGVFGAAVGKMMIDYIDRHNPYNKRPKQWIRDKLIYFALRRSAYFDGRPLSRMPPTVISLEIITAGRADPVTEEESL